MKLIATLMLGIAGMLGLTGFSAAHAAVVPNTVPAGWWQNAIKLDKAIRTGSPGAKSELAAMWKKYNGHFTDTWADDNAWWGITLQDAYAKYHVHSYHTEAVSLWTYDRTSSWDSACGGAVRQHPGGSQDAIAVAAYAVLSSKLGESAASQHAASWIFTHLQAGKSGQYVAESVNASCIPDPDNATTHLTLGAEIMSYEAEHLNGIAGQSGAARAARARYPDAAYGGIFNIVYHFYL